MVIKARLVQDKVTPGAVRFAEINDLGEPVKGDDSKVTQIYVRKSALGGQVPKSITVTLETE